MIGSILSNNDLDDQGLFSITDQLDPSMYTNLKAAAANKKLTEAAYVKNLISADLQKAKLRKP